MEVRGVSNRFLLQETRIEDVGQVAGDKSVSVVTLRPEAPVRHRL